MLCVGNHTVILLNHWHDVVEEHLLEVFSKATTEATKTTLWTLTLWTLATLRSTLWSTSTLWTWTAEATETTLCTWLASIQTIVHHDDEWNSLLFCDEVVHDRGYMTLIWPTVLVLTHTVLQIQNWELLGWVSEVLVGQINEATTHLLCVGGIVVNLTHSALWHVLHLPEVLVVRWNFDTTTPTACAIVVEAGWIWNAGSVDVQLIVVETRVLWS